MPGLVSDPFCAAPNGDAYGDSSTPEPTIRTVATILISLLIAIALGTVLYVLVLSIGRDALPGAEARVTMPEMAELPAPTRLAPIAGIEHNVMAATPTGSKDRVVVPVQIRNLGSLKQLDQAGIAMFAAATGADFRWLPLRDALQAGLPTVLVRGEAAAGTKLTVTLAPHREHARHGYLARRNIDVEQLPSANHTATVELDGQVHSVRFDLPIKSERAGPLRLQRIDDRQWLPMLTSTSGLTLRRGEQTTLLLGAGSYELQAPLRPGQVQQFAVPESTTVTVNEDLAPPEAAKTQKAKIPKPKGPQ